MVAATQTVPFVRPYLPSLETMVEDVREILTSGMLTKGKYLAGFEAAACEALEASYAVGVSSCTTGLMLMLLDPEREGGEVIVPSFSFIATVLPVIWNNLTPIFVDCDSETFNLDPALVEDAITPRTKAIMATHVFGNPAAINELEQIAQRHGLRLLFDGAHAFGTTYQGKAVGNRGDGVAFSCTPTKLVIAGEGGVVTTRHREFAEMIEVAREYGNPGNYDNTLVGLNGRLPELNAALAAKTLEMLPSNLARRREIARRYQEGLSHSVPGIKFQTVKPGNETSVKDFAIVVNTDETGLDRDTVVKHLTRCGISTRNYFHPPLHLQTALQPWGQSYRGALPVTEKIASEVICLPVYHALTDSEVDYIVECLVEAPRYAAAS